MSMLITCESCASRFRFDERLLKGAKGALVKCPRCRERILVRNPAAPRVIPPVEGPSTPPDMPPVVPRIKPPVAPPHLPQASPPKLTLPTAPAVDTKLAASRTEGQISLAPPKRHAVEADLSVLTGPGPGQIFSEENAVSASGEPGSLSMEAPGKYSQHVADLFRSPSEGMGDRKLSGEKGPPRGRPKAGKALGLPPAPPLYQRPLFIAAVIFILLLSGGAFYYVDYVDGNSGRKLPFPVVPSPAPRASVPTELQVANLRGYPNKQDSGERIYVIRGTVTNVGKSISSGIRIQATLIGRDNQAIMQGESFAGNQIDESLMTHMNRVRIEGFLGMRYGEGNINRDIPVGTSLPFMVVFFDPPEEIRSFTVKAMNVGDAEGIQPPDAEKSDQRVSTQQ